MAAHGSQLSERSKQRSTLLRFWWRTAASHSPGHREVAIFILRSAFSTIGPSSVAPHTTRPPHAHDGTAGAAPAARAAQAPDGLHARRGAPPLPPGGETLPSGRRRLGGRVHCAALGVARVFAGPAAAARSRGDRHLRRSRRLHLRLHYRRSVRLRVLRWRRYWLLECAADRGGAPGHVAGGARGRTAGSERGGSRSRVAHSTVRRRWCWW